MIRLYCPKCQSVVTVEASRADGLATCPHCAQVFRAPTASAPEAPAPAPPPVSADERIIPAGTPGDGDKHQATYDLVADLGPRAPVSLPIEEDIDDAVAEAPEEGEQPRPRRRGRLRPGIDFPEPEPPPPQTLLPGISNFAALLMVVASLWLLVGVIALLQPRLAFLPIGLGGLVAAAGLLWLLTVAFHEDAVTGILCLVLPLYALYFLYRSPSEAGRPFLLTLVGGLILASGLALAAFTG